VVDVGHAQGVRRTDVEEQFAQLREELDGVN